MWGIWRRSHWMLPPLLFIGMTIKPESLPAFIIHYEIPFRIFLYHDKNLNFEVNIHIIR
jgi:hypothetical protein